MQNFAPSDDRFLFNFWPKVQEKVGWQDKKNNLSQIKQKFLYLLFNLIVAKKIF